MENSSATAPCNDSSLATIHNNHDASSSSATGSGDAAKVPCNTATGSCDNKDRIIIKRKVQQWNLDHYVDVTMITVFAAKQWSQPSSQEEGIY